MNIIDKGDFDAKIIASKNFPLEFFHRSWSLFNEMNEKKR